MKTNSVSAALAVHARTITTTRHLIFRRACLWTSFLAFATIAFGPQPAQAAVTEAWVQRYGSEAGSEDNAYKVVTDAAGNVIVAGTTTDNQTGGGSALIIKYSGGGVPLWTNRYNGSASAVAVDSSGNVFVTGSSDFDYATIAYSGAGVPLWTNRYNGPGNNYNQATAVAVDASGNVFVTGWSGYCTLGCSGDYATIAYSGAGVPLWTNRYNGPANGNDQPRTKSSLAIGSDGAVYVTGTSDGLYLSDFATVKYVWQPEIAIQLLSTIPPKVNLTLSGAPNSSWAIERAMELTGPWTNLSTLLIGTNGSAQLQDTHPPYPAGFYRARQQ